MIWLKWLSSKMYFVCVYIKGLGWKENDTQCWKELSISTINN